ncbi:MAG: hypothetical protein NWE76_09570, partial [Candidatus Bathyarchaeota archaeon]|nr:hypothetical protein [Candidatus Bathyarchaeota archaeon]
MKRFSRSYSLLLVTVLVCWVLHGIAPLRASTGNILVGVTRRPSPVVTIKIGEDLNLYFGRVTWAGGQIDLYLSTDGYSNRSEDDVPFGPAFTQAKLLANEIDAKTYEGYSIGKRWINGTIPKIVGVPEGEYYVKAFDGLTDSVAVTDNWIAITAGFDVVPSSGPGKAAM